MGLAATRRGFFGMARANVDGRSQYRWLWWQLNQNSPQNIRLARAQLGWLGPNPMGSMGMAATGRESPIRGGAWRRGLSRRREPEGRSGVQSDGEAPRLGALPRGRFGHARLSRQLGFGLGVFQPNWSWGWAGSRPGGSARLGAPGLEPGLGWEPGSCTRSRGWELWLGALAASRAPSRAPSRAGLPAGLPTSGSEILKREVAEGVKKCGTAQTEQAWGSRGASMESGFVWNQAFY